MKFKQLTVLFVAAAIGASCATQGSRGLSGMSFSDEPLTGKVVWHDLITHDMDSAKAFYSGVLGWTFEEAATGDDREYAVARVADTYVAGLVHVERPAGEQHHSRWLPYLSVEDVDAAVRQSTAAGGSVAVSAREVPLGRVAAVLDTEGAVVGLARSRFGDPDDQTTVAAPGRAVWTELLSNDTDAAARFYRAVAGYDIEAVARRGGTYTYLKSGDSHRAGVMPNPSAVWEPVWLTYFGVDNPAESARQAERLGGRIVLQAAPNVREGSMAVVTDPSGAVLVLQNWRM